MSNNTGPVVCFFRLRDEALGAMRFCGCRFRSDELGGMTVDGRDLIRERDFASIGCRE